MGQPTPPLTRREIAVLTVLVLAALVVLAILGPLPS